MAGYPIRLFGFDTVGNDTANGGELGVEEGGVGWTVLRGGKVVLRWSGRLQGENRGWAVSRGGQ